MSAYSTTCRVPGEPGAVLAEAIANLTYSGFRITQRRESAATLVGPGMRRTRQNPLLGATKVDLRYRSGELRLDAELGGVDFLRRFITWFPLLLSGGIGVFFLILFGGILPAVTAEGSPEVGLFAAGISLLAGAPWLGLGPLMARQIRGRTETALDTLLSNASFAGTVTGDTR